MRNCLAGSVALIGMASCIGIPLGMLCGIYLSEYAGGSWFAHAIRLIVDVLAGVPSILVGVLGYELVARPMGGPTAWAGAVALGVMMCPIIARTTEEMLKLVPNALREASIGIGASKFQTLFRVVIPGAASGIITGIMLAVARVAGETAPLLFTAGGSDQPVFQLNSKFPWFADLDRPFPSLTVRIYQCYNSPDPNDMRQMWNGLFILILLVLVLNICVRVVSNRKKMKAS
jgi:phosphate transport system permease protein